VLERENPQVVIGLLRASGLSPRDFEMVRLAESKAQAEKLLGGLKAKFKVGFRQLLKTLYADATRGDQAKQELLRVAVLVQKHIESLEPQWTPPPALPAHEPKKAVTIHYYPGSNGDARVHTAVDPVDRAMRISTLRPSVKWVRVR